MRRTDVSTADAPAPVTIRRAWPHRAIGALLALVVLIAAACVAGGAWAAATVPDPALPGRSRHLLFDEVGCIDVDPCLAAGTTGAAVYVGGTWTLTTALPEPISAVRGVGCLPSGACLMAADRAEGGPVVWSWAGTAWSGNLLSGAPTTLSSVADLTCGSGSCAVAGTLAGAATVNQVVALRFDGTTWTDLAVPPSATGRSASAIDCATATDCVLSARGTFTEILRWDGTSWTPLTPAPLNGATSSVVDLSCPTAGYCAGIVPETFCYKPSCYTFNRLVVWRAGSPWVAWVAPDRPSFPPTPTFEDIDCVAVDECLVSVLDPSNPHRLARFDGATLTDLETLPSETHSLDCATGDRCVIVTADPLRAQAYWPDFAQQPLFIHRDASGTRLDRSVSGDPGPRDARFTDVLCTSATLCIAVGWAAQGDRQRSLVGTFDGTAWTVTPAAAVDDVRLESIACTSATACVAVGGRYEYQRVVSNLVRTFDGQTWTDVPGDVGGPGFYDRGLTEVACSTPTRCVAAGDLVTVTSWDGPWTLEPEQHGSYAPISSACLPGGPCYAVFSERLMTWTGSTWEQVPLPPVERDGETYDAMVQGVGCATSGPAPRCLVALGAYSNLTTHLLAEGGPGGWTKTLPTAENAWDTVDELACSTNAQCVVIGGEVIPQDHVRNGGDWIPLPPRNLTEPVSLSCVPDRCVHVGNIATLDADGAVTARRPAAEVYDLKAPAV